MTNGTQSNLSVQAGTATQRGVVTQAHASALALAQRGQSQATQGQGPFAAWFGPASSASRVAVASGFEHAASLLQTRWIAYDLDDTDLTQLAYPGIYVLFDLRSSTSIAADVAVDFWNAYVVDPTDAAAALAASVLHEALTQASQGPIADVLGAISAADAQQLAALNPAAALTSVRNYMGYAASLSGASAESGRSTPPAPHGHDVAAAGPALLAGVPTAHLAAIPAAARIVRYAGDGASVLETAACDFARVRRASDGAPGGGSFALATKSPTGVPRTATVVALRPDGRPSHARTTRFGPDGKTPAKLIDTDYRRLRFGPGGPVTGGSLAFVVRNPRGLALSASVEAIDALGNLTTVATVRYGRDGKTPASSAQSDFRGARFNSDHRVVAGTIATTVFNPDGKIVARTAAIFDRGAVKLTSSRRYKPGSSTPVRNRLTLAGPHNRREEATTVTVDYSGASCDVDGAIAGGVALTRLLRAGRAVAEMRREYRGAAPAESTRTTKLFARDGVTVVLVAIDELRSDGTLASRLLARLGDRERLTSVDAYAYAAGGKTILNHARSDFSRAILSAANEVLGGVVAVDSLRPNGARKARVEMTFGPSQARGADNGEH